MKFILFIMMALFCMPMEAADYTGVLKPHVKSQKTLQIQRQIYMAYVSPLDSVEYGLTRLYYSHIRSNKSHRKCEEITAILEEIRQTRKKIIKFHRLPRHINLSPHIK